MIIAIIFYAECWWKKDQVFAVKKKDRQHQAEKKTRVEIDPKNVISQKYHSFSNVVSEKNLDTLPPY